MGLAPPDPTPIHQPATAADASTGTSPTASPSGTARPFTATRTSTGGTTNADGASQPCTQCSLGGPLQWCKPYPQGHHRQWHSRHATHRRWKQRVVHVFSLALHLFPRMWPCNVTSLTVHCRSNTHRRVAGCSWHPVGNTAVCKCGVRSNTASASRSQSPSSRTPSFQFML